MGAACWVVIVASTLWVSPVALPMTEGAGTTMRVVVKSQGRTPSAELPEHALVAELTDRVTQAFTSEGTGRLLVVELVWDQGIEVVVAEGDEVWARRSFARPADANARVATLVAMWLFVRSTLTRASHEQLPEPMPVTLAVPPVATVAPAREPVVPVMSGWRFGAALTGGVVAGSLWSLGVLGQASTTVSDRFSVGGEVGYLLSPGLRALTLHEVPVNASVSLRLPQSDHVAVGLLGSLRLKRAVTADKDVFALGGALGPVVESRAPLARAGALFLRAGLLWQLVRQRYVLNQRTVSEPPWALSLAFGVQL